MREHKFRGQRIDPENNPGKWEYGSLISVAPPDDIPYFSKLTYPLIWNENGVYSVDPKTVGEYTGLTDKNGKEIYEGDIVNWDGEIGEMVFNETEWRLQLNWESVPQAFSGFVHQLEIIGNIHQHPELLTPKQ